MVAIAIAIKDPLVDDPLVQVSLRIVVPFLVEVVIVDVEAKV